MTHTQRYRDDRSRILWGGILAGIGLGGFFDGIVFHQILQWHHFVSNVYPTTTVAGLEINTLSDGLFHAATYAFTITGLFLLWGVASHRETTWPMGLLVGTLLMGWGLLHVVDGVVNHFVLQLHHIRTGPNELAYDLVFLALGAVMLIGGWFLTQAGFRKVEA